MTVRPLDTNVLIRVLTGDPPDQARKSAALMRAAEPDSLLVLDVIVAELVHVLRRIYKTPRDDIATIVASLIAMRSVRLDDGGLLRRTLALYAERRMDWPDAYLVATAEQRGLATVISFDRFDVRIRDLPVRRQEP